jgi:hypothetical protein
MNSANVKPISEKFLITKEFEDFQAFLYKFKDVQGLAYLFSNYNHYNKGTVEE